MASYTAPKRTKRFCDVCNVHCTSAFDLCDHVAGNKHRRRIFDVSPDCLPHLSRLQYFIDTYMKLEPLVGLEYVEETHKMSECQYKCLLCGFHGKRRPALMHITGWDHIKKYLDKEHPMLSMSAARFHQKFDRTKALQQAAVKVYKIYGRSAIKEIGFVCPSPKGSPDRKTATCGRHARTLRYRERADEECRQQIPGFKDNADFVDYLQKFEIRNDEDARILKQIAQNCSLELVRFLEEQVRENEPGEGEVGPQTSAIETEQEVNCEKVAPAASEPQTDPTHLFFSSIKNMEESEVVSILHKITTTNPAFRGFDVPNAIKYLQATGRLKTS